MDINEKIYVLSELVNQMEHQISINKSADKMNAMLAISKLDSRPTSNPSIFFKQIVYSVPESVMSEVLGADAYKKTIETIDLFSTSPIDSSSTGLYEQLSDIKKQWYASSRAPAVASGLIEELTPFLFQMKQAEMLLIEIKNSKNCNDPAVQEKMSEIQKILKILFTGALSIIQIFQTTYSNHQNQQAMNNLTSIISELQVEVSETHKTIDTLSQQLQQSEQQNQLLQKEMFELSQQQVELQKQEIEILKETKQSNSTNEQSNSQK